MAKPKDQIIDDIYPANVIRIGKRNRLLKQERQERKPHKGKGKVKEENSTQESTQGDSA